MLHRLASLFRLCSQQISSSPVPPLTAFSFLRFHPNLYSPLPKSQLLHTTRFCPTPPTVEETHRFPHSAICNILAQHQLPKFFVGVSPNNKFQQVHKFIPYKRKLLNTTVASFHRCTAQKNRRTSKFCTHQFIVRGRGTQQTTLNSQKLVPNNMSSSHTVTNFNEPTYETTRTSFPNHLGKCKRPPLAQCATKKITWVKHSQCAHSKVQARSSRKTTTSARVRDSSTVREIAGGSSSGLGILHCGMMAAATKMKMIVQGYVLPQIRSSTIPGRVANYSRLPIEGTLDG